MEFQARVHSAELMLRDIEIKHLRSQLPGATIGHTEAHQNPQYPTVVPVTNNEA